MKWAPLVKPIDFNVIIDDGDEVRLLLVIAIYLTMLEEGGARRCGKGESAPPKNPLG